MILMPFNFDRMPDGRVFISNLAGFHHFLGEQEFLDLVNGHISQEQSSSLESKLFICGDESSSVTPYALREGANKFLI